MPRSTLLCTGWRRVQETQCCVRECGGYNIWVYNAEATVSYIMPEFIESIEAYFCSYVPKSIMKFVRHEKTWHPHQRLRPNMALAWTKGVTTLLPGEAALTLRHASLVDSTVTSGEISSFHSGVPRLWQKRKKTAPWKTGQGNTPRSCLLSIQLISSFIRHKDTCKA